MSDSGRKRLNAKLALLIIIALMVGVDLLFHIVPYLCTGPGCRSNDPRDYTAQFNDLNEKLAGLATALQPVAGAIETGNQIKVVADGLTGKVDGIDTRVAAIDTHATAIDGKVDTLNGKVDALGSRLGSLATGEAVAVVDGKVDTLTGKVDAIDTDLNSLAKEDTVAVIGTRVAAIDGQVNTLTEKVDAIDTELDPLAKEDTVAVVGTQVAAIDGKVDALTGKADGIDERTTTIDGKADTLIGMIGSIEPGSVAKEETLVAIGGKMDTLVAKTDAIDGRTTVIDGKTDTLIGMLDALTLQLDPLAKEETLVAVGGKIDSLANDVTNVRVIVQSIDTRTRISGPGPGTGVAGSGSGRAEIWMTVWFDPVATKQDLGETEELIIPRIRQAVSGHDNCRIFVEGHADASGNDLLNRTLSQERVDYVAGFLDEAFPNMVDPHHSAKGERGLLRWTRDGEPSIYNRRVEIKIQCPAVQTASN